ncbi:ubiquitin carboxyl-terminal hydrolase 50 [Ranitomeya imitator]|uniref:ubiquitin carboxyl-terminal hydrolase 50 n=1 Tax=Ranitomeya imitator TaxID=111125 RepID=UPI0037E8CA89
MDITVATLTCVQWSFEDYSAVRIATSSCSLCGRCFHLKGRIKLTGGNKSKFGKAISQAAAAAATRHLFFHFLDEQILGRVQKKIIKNVKRLHKNGRPCLVEVEQADVLKWVGDLLLSGLIGPYGKSPKESVSTSMKKYLTSISQQPFQDLLHLFCAEGSKNVRTLFQEIDLLQERLGLNFRTSYRPVKFLFIEKYKIDFEESQHPRDLRVVLLVEKETGYICNFYIYSITEVLRKAQCIPFLYIIRKLLIPFCKRNYTVQIDSSALVNEAIFKEFNKLGLNLQFVSKLGEKYGSLVNKENHMDKMLKILNGYKIFPIYGRDINPITFSVAFGILVKFSCINAFILYSMEHVNYGEYFSLQRFVKMLSEEILGNNTHLSVFQYEETSSDEDQDADMYSDSECEAGATASDYGISTHRKRIGLTGLRNLGNTCYMNAVLQCLSCTTTLVEYFFSHQFETFVTREKKEMLNAFANLMADMWFGKDQYVSPEDFLAVIYKLHPPFGKRTQQDAQELLIYTLNALHEDLTNKNKTGSGNAGSSSGIGGNASESLITNLLQGVLRQNTTCLVCENTSYKDDIFTVLSLPLASQDETSIQECLKCFFQQVTLTSTNKIFCPFCKMKQNATVKVQIWKLPRILILHLKRFEYKSHQKRKLKTSVDFPLDHLDLSPFLSSCDVKQQKYKLYAVVNHFGELDIGHYTAFCKHPVTKEWNAFDDIRCFRISESMVKTSSAYILFYTSQTFGSPKKTSSCSMCI